MRPHLAPIFAALLGLATRLGAADAPQASAASQPAPQDALPPGRQAVVLHTWPTAVPLGFTAPDRFLAYETSRRVFESHDLGKTNAPLSGWDPPEEGNRIFGGTLSPDRRALATLAEVGKQQSRIQLWNAATGERTGPAFAPSDVAHLAFSPDGKLLAGLVALDGTVRVWDAASGELRWSMSLPQPMQVAWIGLEFSPDGRFLAARNSYALQIWDVTSRRVAGAYFYMAISPNWKLAHGFALGTRTQGPPRAALLDLSDPNQPVPAPGLPEDADASCAFAADGRLLALNTRRQVLSVWDTASRRLIHDLKVAVGQIMRMTVSPDGRVLAALELDPSKRSVLERTVRLWDVATGRPLAAPSPLPGRFWDWQFDPDSRYLAIACAQGNDRFGAQLWRLPPNPPHARAD